jgi:hypothetical protein
MPNAPAARPVVSPTAPRGKDLLNAIQAQLINFANDSGIILLDEFKTVAKFKEFVIAFTIKSLMDIGLTIREAYDLVFDAGSFDALAASVWQANQAK